MALAHELASPSSTNIPYAWANVFYFINMDTRPSSTVLLVEARTKNGIKTRKSSRLTIWLFKMDHIRDAVGFPRTMNRVVP
jgi:hypothetical protein